MEFLKALFADGPLSYEQLVEKATAAKLNIVDLAAGGYISQSKYNDKVAALNSQVEGLTQQLTQRDTDMKDLQDKLAAAQTDATKLGEAQTALADLQAKYETDKKDMEGKLARQAYEFDIRERAGGLKFSSAAAKKAFIQEAISKGFKKDGDTLLGYEDFVTKYKADDPGAFAPDEPPTEEPHQDPPPQIVAPTGSKAPAGSTTPFNWAFGGVRPKPQE